MIGVQKVGVEFCGDGFFFFVKVFPSLEVLIIEEMLEWQQWFWSNSFNKEVERAFPRLHELTIRNCPKLDGKLPSYPFLKRLNLCNCPQLANLHEFLR